MRRIAGTAIFTQRAIVVVYIVIAVFPAHSFQQECECGKTVVSKIIRGRPVARGEFPWMVALVSKEDPTSILCGGTLITRRFAITAFHCTKHDPSTQRVFIGTVDLTFQDANSVLEKIKQFIKYMPENHNQDDDLALVELKRSVRLNPYIQPICLPPPGQDFSHVQAVVAGFGETNDQYELTGLSVYSESLLAGTVNVTTTDNCNLVMERYKRPIGENMLCAGSYQGQPDHCFGDSGGPLMYLDKTTSLWKLIGIVASAYECANPRDYSFYTNVSHFREWIQTNSDYQDCYS